MMSIAIPIRCSVCFVLYITTFEGIIGGDKMNISLTSSYKHIAATMLDKKTVALDDTKMALKGNDIRKDVIVSTLSDMFIKKTRQANTLLDIHPTVVDVKIPFMLKFHVSGQIDSRYALELTNYKFPKKLKDFSRLLDAQLTKVFISEDVHAVHMDQIRNNTDFIAFSATLYFDKRSRIDVKIIEELIRDDKDFKASNVYVFEYCTKNTCNADNGYCELIKGSAQCRCKSGFHKDRCVPITYSDNDYIATGSLCGVTLIIIAILLVVFCRTYKFPGGRPRSKSRVGSSVRTGHSSNINSYQFTSYLKRGSNQATYVKKPDQMNGFPTYKNMEGVIPLNGMVANGTMSNGIHNKAFVVDNANDSSSGDSIYKKQLKKFFEEAPQMRLNNAMISRNNSFNEKENFGTKKQNNSPNILHQSPSRIPIKVNDGKGNDIRSPYFGGGKSNS